MDPYNKTGIVILFMLFINSYSGERVFHIFLNRKDYMPRAKFEQQFHYSVAAVMGFSEVENPAESLRKVALYSCSMYLVESFIFPVDMHL